MAVSNVGLAGMDLTMVHGPSVGREMVAAEFACVVEAARRVGPVERSDEGFEPVAPVEGVAAPGDAMTEEDYDERPSRDAVAHAANEVLKRLRVRDVEDGPVFG